MTQNRRQYGTAPSTVVVLHGGPGGAGEVAPFAEALAGLGHDVLEPFQAAMSVDAQVAELHSQISAHCTAPVTLIGWSWGAWLGCLFAARHPDAVQTLILVGSGPFEARHAEAIRHTKAARLTAEMQAELGTLRLERGNPTHVARFIELSDVADTYARDQSPPPVVHFDERIHAAVWQDAKALRQSGALLKAVGTIRCPVTAIHGDYDPRPAEGVSAPLLRVLPNATFHLLANCGHKPWQEVHARDAFYRLIKDAIG